MKYVSVVPQPPLDQLVDDLYYLEGTPPYSRLKLPPMPSAVLILNLGDRFLIGGSGARPAEFTDGCLLTTATRHIDFAYPALTRSVGVHFKPWGWAPFAGIPGSEVRDLPLTVEQVWGRYGDELRDRLDAASTPERMLALLEEVLRRRVVDVPGLGLVQHASGRIAAAAGAVSIGGLCEDAGVSTTHPGRCPPIDFLLAPAPASASESAHHDARRSDEQGDHGLCRRLDRRFHRRRERPDRPAVRLGGQR